MKPFRSFLSKHGLSSLVFFGLSQICSAQIIAPDALENTPKVGVMVIDGPVDLQNEEISKFVDLSVMQNHYSISEQYDVKGLREEKNESKSWVDLNEEYLHALTTDLKEPLTSNQIGLIDLMYNPNFSSSMKVNAALTTLGAQLKPSWKKNWEKVRLYIHGTATSGVVLRGLRPEDVRFISAPIKFISTSAPERITLEQFETLINSGANAIHSLYSEISKAIQTEGIKVANLSIVLQKKKLNKLKKKLSILDQIRHRKKLKLLVQKYVDQYHLAVRQLLEENPQTIFVFAAGNSGLDLSTKKGRKDNLFATLKRSNSLFVGAMDGKGRLSPYSNYGDQIVDVATGGVQEGLRIGGGKLYASGTSFSAPKVANELVFLALQNPQATAEELIQMLLKRTPHSPFLKGKITEGRYIPYPLDCFYP